MSTETHTETSVSLAVSTVIFALRPNPATGLITLWLPLVKRIREPHEGKWALPGGPLTGDDDLVASAGRTLKRCATGRCYEIVVAGKRPPGQCPFSFVGFADAFDQW